MTQKLYILAEEDLRTLKRLEKSLSADPFLGFYGTLINGIISKVREVEKDEVMEALLTALPYVTDAMDDPAFKKGVVAKHVDQIRKALKE